LQKWGEDIFKPTNGNESLHETNNDKEVGVKLCNIKSNCHEYNVPILQRS